MQEQEDMSPTKPDSCQITPVLLLLFLVLSFLIAIV